MGLDYLVQFTEGKSTKAPALTEFAQADDLREDCVEFHCKFNYLKEMLEKLSLTNMGAAYLVNFVEGEGLPKLLHSLRLPRYEEVRNASAGRSRGLLPSENLGLQALLSITEGKFDDARQPKNFMRSTSALAAKV
ncbi:uncharacterized protein LOC141644186 isoform X1 [Silene latifolia]|uniref:uncharacterized protein LOC141644186 isoform X1 n=1 Tax=Silene latifolia TaxID=37657 RepID=UPI003D780469